MGIKFTGLDEFEERLKQMKDTAKEFNHGKKVSFSDLFPTVFMSRYTQFRSFEEFLTAGGFEVNTQEDFDAIPNDVMDSHVAKTTKFRTWEEMASTAATEHVAKKLGF